jgi:hypothetical protein
VPAFAPLQTLATPAHAPNDDHYYDLYIAAKRNHGKPFAIEATAAMP